MVETRIDPEDNIAYTWKEIAAHYKGVYTYLDIVAYWEGLTVSTAEKRVDPEDNMAYTWEEFAAHYKGVYTHLDIVAYWEGLAIAKNRKGKKKKLDWGNDSWDSAGWGNNEPRMPDPPVDGDGEWVHRENFTGNKSFGFFVCSCGRSWTTAHCYKIYKQGCQGCEEESLAYYMWQNHGAQKRREDRDDIEEKPHDESRCEACRLGKCDRVTWLGQR